MALIECRKCGKEETLELHHLIPKCIGGTDKDGRRRLCKKHQDILSQMILKEVFKFVPTDLEDSCREAIKEFSLGWIYQNE